MPDDEQLGYHLKNEANHSRADLSRDKYFVAECFDLPVVTQALTVNELMKNEKEAIALQLEGEDPAHFGLAPDASLLARYELEREPQIHTKA